MLALAACGNESSPTDKPDGPEQKPVPPEVMGSSASSHGLTIAPELLASKKDLVCGMPVSAGITDTTSIDGKLYGFCAPECKDAFVKNPKDYIKE